MIHASRSDDRGYYEILHVFPVGRLPMFNEDHRCIDGAFVDLSSNYLRVYDGAVASIEAKSALYQTSEF